MFMKLLLFMVLLFFTSCSLPNHQITESKIITIKFKKIKFSDLGYIRSSDKNIELELFIAGKSAQKISINHLICVKNGCMTKSGFNSDYLNKSYPDDILQNIILAKAIYDGKNLVKTEDGFEQIIDDGIVYIIYRVGAGEISFRDLKNGIIFNIKDSI